MRILILGASGMTGQAIARALQHDHAVCGTYFHQQDRYVGDDRMFRLDAGDTNALRELLLRIDPDVIISSMRGDFDDQLQLHRTAAQHLQNTGGRFIYMSSANVYDHAVDSPHYESDPPDAESDYGRFKIECEQLLSDMLLKRAAIIRVPFIWSRQSPRFLNILKQISDGIPVKCHPNLFCNHTIDTQIARCIHRIIRDELTGIFHVGSRDIREYTDFIAELLAGLGHANYPVELEAEPDHAYFMALLSERSDLGNDWSLTSSEIIAELVEPTRNR